MVMLNHKMSHLAHHLMRTRRMTTLSDSSTSMWTIASRCSTQLLPVTHLLNGTCGTRSKCCTCGCGLGGWMCLSSCRLLMNLKSEKSSTTDTAPQLRSRSTGMTRPHDLHSLVIYQQEHRC